jgi:hypothetical protein
VRASSVHASWVARSASAEARHPATPGDLLAACRSPRRESVAGSSRASPKPAPSSQPSRSSRRPASPSESDRSTRPDQSVHSYSVRELPDHTSDDASSRHDKGRNPARALSCLTQISPAEQGRILAHGAGPPTDAAPTRPPYARIPPAATVQHAILAIQPSAGRRGDRDDRRRRADSPSRSYDSRTDDQYSSDYDSESLSGTGTHDRSSPSASYSSMSRDELSGRRGQTPQK